jgi:putative membrane protein
MKRHGKSAVLALAANEELSFPESPAWRGFPINMNVRDLPTVNACLNALSLTLLVSGFLAVRTKRVDLHRACMGAALITSTLFLISYLIYHYSAGSVKFTGQGWVRPVYFFILITHIVLATAVVPLVLRTVFLALRERLEEHRRLARWTFPIWSYVSLTGIVVYVMLYKVVW